MRGLGLLLTLGACNQVFGVSDTELFQHTTCEDDSANQADYDLDGIANGVDNCRAHLQHRAGAPWGPHPKRAPLAARRQSDHGPLQIRPQMLATHPPDVHSSASEHAAPSAFVA